MSSIHLIGGRPQSTASFEGLALPRNGFKLHIKDLDDGKQFNFELRAIGVRH